MVVGVGVVLGSVYNQTFSPQVIDLRVYANDSTYVIRGAALLLRRFC